MELEPRTEPWYVDMGYDLGIGVFAENVTLESFNGMWYRPTIGYQGSNRLARVVYRRRGMESAP